MKMAKPYYADYVNHILRFYFRYDRNKGFKSDVDKSNYIAADKVIQRMSDTDRELLSAVFTQESINLADNVSRAATAHGEDPVRVWSLVSMVTSKVAKERRLL
jgi:hypothetical protein